MRYKVEIQAYSSILGLFTILLIVTHLVVGNNAIECTSIVVPHDSISISPKYATDTIHINTATVRQLKRFGFSYYEIYNVVAYREAGGKIRSWDKLTSIYGIDTLKHFEQKHRIAYDDIVIPDKQIAHLRNYERYSDYSDKKKNNHKATTKQISLFYTDSAELIDYGVDKIVIDSLLWYRKNYIVSGKISLDTLRMASASTIGSYMKPHLGERKKISIKSKAVQTMPLQVELNAATAEKLCQVRYVGEYTANKILDYRKKLGGFVSTEQLREIYALSKNENIEQICSGLIVDKENVAKININSTDLKRLKQHPYVSEKMCTALLVCRKRKIKIINF